MHQQKFQVEGMTCTSCQGKVKNIFTEIDGVKSVDVDLGTGTINVRTIKFITNELASQKLSPYPKYSLKLSTGAKPESKLQTLRPLFIILGFIMGASILINLHRGWNWQAFMLDYMGIFLVVFSFFKFLDFKGFPASFSQYDPLSKIIPAYATIYPFLELGFGVFILMRLSLLAVIPAVVVILGLTTIGVIQTLRNKRKIQCACLGTTLNLPMTQATLIENSMMIIMGVMAFLMLIS